MSVDRGRMVGEQAKLKGLRQGEAKSGGIIDGKIGVEWGVWSAS